MTIPAEAMPVVEVLRRDVPRPETLPEFRNTRLRWGRTSRRFGKCAMGLHPKAWHDTPMTEDTFPAPESAVVAFYGWWDSQTDPQAAVDAVWPPA